MQRGVRHLGLVSRSPEQTQRLGELLGSALMPGDVLLLDGPFGAGKTTFVQGLASGAGAEGRVTSPSFTLINEYQGRLPIHHVDLFRLKQLDLEMEQALEDCEDSDGATVVEWPQLLPVDLREGSLRIDLQVLGDTERSLVLHAEGSRWDPENLAAILEEAAMFNAPGEQAQ
jgi:tRNA threonylcarbamoyladenosine biosynthesis protein TsaE